MTLKPTDIIYIVEELPKRLVKEGITGTTDRHIWDVQYLLYSKMITRDGLYGVMKYLAEHPDDSTIQALKALDMETKTIDDVLKIVKDEADTLKLRGELNEGALMGRVMKILRGKADGKTINIIVKEAVRLGGLTLSEGQIHDIKAMLDD